MISFESDYNNGAHPAILDALIATNQIKTPGYGSDEFCQSAVNKIKNACENADADVYFLTGGTQTNSIIISTMLKPYEGVVAATSGHVSIHEAGAIEYTGHKVLELPATDGKLSAQVLSDYLMMRAEDDNKEHMVFPGMVYISYPTEYGTLYSKQELSDIYNTCTQYHIPLFIDGARLGYGLMSPYADLTLPELAKLCDVFYIGGTKVGALCGEAVVFTKNNTPAHFTNLIKKHGALLAKGRLLGIQFDTLFTDNLYMKISKHAIDMAMQLKQMLTEKGYTFLLDSPTNQQFVIVTNDKLAELQKNVAVSFWESIDDNHTAIRFATSWATTKEDLVTLSAYL